VSIETFEWIAVIALAIIVLMLYGILSHLGTITEEITAIRKGSNLLSLAERLEKGVTRRTS
jgi:hypothetical protein